MHYSYIAPALLALPGVLASPLVNKGLEARAALPTCNPNNVAIVKQQKPKSKIFCSNWQAAKTHSAPVTVTGLSNAQISNICKCIQATSYVSNTPLTATSSKATTISATSSVPKSTSSSAIITSSTPATTSKASTSSSSSSYASRSSSSSSSSSSSISSFSSSSVTTSSAVLSTTASCVSSNTTNADGSMWSLLCDSSLDGAFGASYSVANLVNCQAKCKGACAGVVYNPATRSCQLYTEVDGSYDSLGTKAAIYLGNNSTTTSSSSTSKMPTSSTPSSISSSTAAPVPEVFYIYATQSSGPLMGLSSEVQGNNYYLDGNTYYYSYGLAFNASRSDGVPGVAHAYNYDNTTGYVYLNGTDYALVAYNSYFGNGAVSVGEEYINYNDWTPLECDIKSDLTMTCHVESYNNVMFANERLYNGTNNYDSQAQYLTFAAGSGSKSQVNLYISGSLPNITNPQSATEPILSNGSDKELIINGTFPSSDITPFVSSTSSSVYTNVEDAALLFHYHVQSSSAEANLTQSNVTMYSGDSYHFSTNVTFNYGSGLPAGVSCSVSWALNNSVVEIDTFDSTSGTTYQFVIDGETAASGNVTVGINTTCSTASGVSHDFPVSFDSVSLIANYNDTRASTFSSNGLARFVQFYSGSGLTQTQTKSGDIPTLNTRLQVSNEQAALQACADKVQAAGLLAFDVHYLTSNSSWMCVGFPKALQSPSLFNVTNVNATNVSGYFSVAMD